MTTPTLPTRADGGIDWDQLAFGIMRTFGLLVAAHERERCALIAENELRVWGSGNGNEQRVDALKLVLYKIRKMEP